MPISFVMRAALAVVVASGLALGGSAAAVAVPATQSAVMQTHAAVKPFKHAPRPTISGAHKVGAKLTAHPGTWKPGHVTLHYRWKVNGKAVKGATHRTFRVRDADAGKKITVAVTAKKSHFRTTTKTSKAITIKRRLPIVIAGDGEYRVGHGVQPGTYVTSGSTTDCYWERDSSFDGSFDSIIANDLGSGQRVITVKATDYGVTFSRCGSWIRSSDAKRPSSIGEGTYLVGSQLAPGEYQARNNGDCYWETLSGFSGEFGDIISNDLVASGQVVVDIPASAIGFSSSRCGTWTRIG